MFPIYFFISFFANLRGGGGGEKNKSIIVHFAMFNVLRLPGKAIPC